MSERLNAKRHLVRALLLCGLGLTALACGDDDDTSSAPGGRRKDSGMDNDAAMDAAMDAQIDEYVPPDTSTKPPDKRDARVDSALPQDTGPVEPPPEEPTCADLDCESMSNDCQIVTCDTREVRCVVTLVEDGMPCGSRLTDNCTFPDSCKAGVCEPNHEEAGEPCGNQDDECQLDDQCDGMGVCTDNGFAEEGTECGDQVAHGDCDQPDACDAFGNCRENFVLKDTSCGDDGVDCRFDDHCDGFGNCDDGGFWESGSCPDGAIDGIDDGTGQLYCPCPGGNLSQSECHPTPDVCVEGTCRLGNVPDGSSCGSPSTDPECDEDDSCLLGVCMPNNLPSTEPCGDTNTNTVCDRPDHCDGGGHCDYGFAGPEVECGSAPSTCHTAATCSGAGTCEGGGILKDEGEQCGAAPGSCYLPRLCDAVGTCLAAEPKDEGESCGNPVATDPQCDAPDSCDGAGTCLPQHVPAGEVCGDPNPNECSDGDSCDGQGECDSHDLPEGTDCGDQGLTCVVDDSCDGDGSCTDNGFDSPCSLSGAVSAGGSPASGVDVAVIGPGATSATTDSNGEFTLDAPLGQDIVLRVDDVPGYYGDIRARVLTHDEVEQGLMIELESDGSISEPADEVSLSIDPDLGAVFVLFSGTLTGAEGVTISRPHANPIAYVNQGFQYSDTIMSTSGGSLYFYDVQPGTMTITPVDGPTTSCEAISSVASYPVVAHAVTWISIECE